MATLLRISWTKQIQVGHTHTHTCVHFHHALTRVYIYVCVLVCLFGCIWVSISIHMHVTQFIAHTQHSHQLTHTISPKCTRTSMHAHTHTRVCKRSIACNENGRNSAHVSSSYSLPTLLILILLLFLLLTMPCAQFAQFSALSYCASLSPACMQSPHPFHVPCSTSPRVPL